MNSPGRLKAPKPLKTQQAHTSTRISTQEQAAKQRLLQVSETQFISKESSDKLCSFLQPTHNPSPHSSRAAGLLPKFYVSADLRTHHRRQCQNQPSPHSHSQDQSSSSQSPRRTAQMLIRSPVSLSHYIVTGGSPCPEARPSCASAPKSDYIIRQRRNHKKLKRIKEKRQVHDHQCRTGIFDRLVMERQLGKVGNMKAKFPAWIVGADRFQLEPHHQPNK